MDQIKIPFGTPEPISYPETDTNFDVSFDALCRINGFVIVTEYPSGYEDEAALRAAVKETALGALTEYLKNQKIGRMLFNYKGRDPLLQEAIENALSEKDIRAEATIANFNLLDPTEDDIKALMMEHRPIGAVYAGPDQMPFSPSMANAYAGPALPPSIASTLMAYAGPAQPSSIASTMMVYAGPVSSNPGIGMMNLMQQQKDTQKDKTDNSVYCFCPACGYLNRGSKFCPECGTPLKDAVFYRDCPDCGNRVPAEDRFCRECGKPFT